MSTIHCRIVTPHGVYKEMDTSILNVVTLSGERGILPNHVPVVIMLKISRMTTVENGQRIEYAIAGGMLYFRDNTAEILTDAIESKDEIDVDRAVAAKTRAEKRLSSGRPNLDQERAEVALKRAINRINVVQRH
ncbi:MAG: ATP synthase F1 subunit epsilon [Solobacterium sp.]|nr:ATP synthase F1 subunit epsilon [Solobacterium sp.]